MWIKWDKRDGQGPQKKGISEDVRELIYRWATMCEKPNLA